MAFKMKAGKEGPFKKNYPSAFKDNGDKKVTDPPQKTGEQLRDSIMAKDYWRENQTLNKLTKSPNFIESHSRLSAISKSNLANAMKGADKKAQEILDKRKNK
jgi:hypothetical protein